MAGLFAGLERIGQAMVDKVYESKSEVVKPNAPLTPAGILRGQKMIDEMKRNRDTFSLYKRGLKVAAAGKPMAVPMSKEELFEHRVNKLFDRVGQPKIQKIQPKPMAIRVPKQVG